MLGDDGLLAGGDTDVVLRLGVLWALAVASTHYLTDLQSVSSGYVVPDDADVDAESAIMDDADAAAEE